MKILSVFTCLFLMFVSGSAEAFENQFSFSLGLGTSRPGVFPGIGENHTRGKMLSLSHVWLPRYEGRLARHVHYEAQAGGVIFTNAADTGFKAFFAAAYVGLGLEHGPLVVRLAQGVAGFSNADGIKIRSRVQLPTKLSIGLTQDALTLTLGHTHFSNGGSNLGLDYTTIEARFSVW